MRDWLEAARLRTVDLQGSTRSAALIRLGLVLLMWNRWAAELMPFRNLSDERLLVGGLFYASSVMMFIGYKTRLATASTGLSLLLVYYWLGLYLGHEPWTHHHTYVIMIMTVFLAFTDCGGSYSLDRWLAVRAAERDGRPPPPESGQLMGLSLIAIQISLIYFWGAFDKTTAVWFSGARMEHYALHFFLGSDYPTVPGFHALMVLTAVIVVVVEYAIIPALWFPRTQKWAFVVGLVLHGLFYYLIPVGTYSLTMALSYLAFVHPDAVHRVLDQLQGVAPETPIAAK